MKPYFRYLIILLFVSLCTSSFAQKPLQIYGGKDHDQYLGCLNCNNYDTNSIWNSYGKYGSSYNANSIWNSYGTFGNSYNSLCPFNDYATEPPVIVDKDGNFYGYLTTNTNHEKRCTTQLALIIYEHWKEIQQDVSGWYEKIFK